MKVQSLTMRLDLAAGGSATAGALPQRLHRVPCLLAEGPLLVVAALSAFTRFPAIACRIWGVGT